MLYDLNVEPESNMIIKVEGEEAEVTTSLLGELFFTESCVLSKYWMIDEQRVESSDVFHSPHGRVDNIGVTKKFMFLSGQIHALISINCPEP